ncbi:dTDP-glucose 4,6-dehydratase [Synchytrium microbalum]|uniref:dTDP-glucose 4,6-dehydratase n=1 Tax=Synchytrium microbalum TaxID=1806994 RepID=A0A507C0E6_9FUNG|nr:dTDP-glucose 4,6-dehydratase [Synchytrium microbalum]TPX31534.1 dTDP-glucose 4,6-dehydratase [Synchytrium microbalum]
MSNRCKYPPDPAIRNVLVTGGAGFIASHVINYLIATYPDYNIINFDKLDYVSSLHNLQAVSDKPNYTFVRGDITSVDLVNYVVQERNVDTILHFAASTHVDNSFGDSLEFTHNNVMGTHVLLEAAREFQVKKFIHVSTDEVYGETQANMPDREEETILAPSNPYSATKAAAESLVKAYQKSFKLPAIITRSNNVYGPFQYPEKVIPKFICSLLSDKNLYLHGDGSNSRHYIYITDVVDAIDTIMHKGVSGATYNIGAGSDSELTNLNLARILLRKFGLQDRASEIIEHVADRAFNDQRYAIDSSRLEALGWKQCVDFDTGIAETITWYRDNWKTWWEQEVELRPHSKARRRALAVPST